MVTLVLVGVITGIVAISGADGAQDSPGVALAGTLVQDLVLVATALLLARSVAAPRPAHFGLRPVLLRRGLAAAGVALLCFYAFSAAYTALLQPGGEQETLDRLGVDRGIGFVIAAAVLVVGIAPLAEEFFFRGFFYGCLRSRLGALAAAGVSGAVFGSLHYTGPDTLPLLPVLAVLGFTFCVLYEWTGSLYPAIWLHVVNNTLAFAVAADQPGGAEVALLVGVAALTTYLLAARQTQSPALSR